MKLRVLLEIAWIALAGVALTSAHAADFWGGSVDVTSDYLVRGLSLTDHSPALQGDIHYHAPSGWSAGLSASTVKFGRGIPATVELDVYLGFSLPVSADWAARMQVVHYDYPWQRRSSHYGYEEIVGAVAYRDSLFFTVAWAPDVTMVIADDGYHANRSAFSYEAATQVPIRGVLAAAAGVGYYDLSDVADLGYWYWNAGLVCTFDAIGLDLTYVGTSAESKRLYYPGTASDRVVLTLSYHF